MMYKYFLLLINIYNVLSFKNLFLNNKLKIKKTLLFSNNNNIFFNKNNSRILHTDTYLETLTLRKHKQTKKLIKNISFDDILLYNNYIEAIYDNINEFLIIEFKNNSKFSYYYNNNFLHIKEIINNTKIDYINLNNYPLYITNSPFGFLLFEKK